MLSTRTVRGLAALATTAAVATVAAAPSHAAAVPMHQCWVNGVSAPPGDVVSGTPGNDVIFCDSDVEGATIWGGAGNDEITVRGMIIDAAVMGGDGDDIIRTKHLVPEKANSMVRGNHGNDTIHVGRVSGTPDHGANVRGDDGNDKIKTMSVTGPGGLYERGGGLVTGNDGDDILTVGTIDLGGRVHGGSEKDTIEAAALGTESGGLIQAGPGDDKISGPEGATLTVGPYWGVIDAGVGNDTCKAKTNSTRASISGCP